MYYVNMILEQQMDVCMYVMYVCNVCIVCFHVFIVCMYVRTYV